MKVLLKISLLIVFAVYLVFAVTKFNGVQKPETCSAVNVMVEDSVKAVFITPEEIRSILVAAEAYPLGREMKRIDCVRIGKVLTGNPFVSDALCYKTAGGHVVIKVRQRLPVMRVISGTSGDYFIDAHGKIMPRMHYTADLAVATGSISVEYARKHLVPLGVFLRDNVFWNRQVEQIHVDSAGNMEMIPRVGNHVVYIGEPSGIPQKLQRLKIFYEKALNKIGWNKYSWINIEYDNQIVCKKQ